MKEQSDEQLVSRCLEGSQDAWTALIRRYRQLIYAVIRSYRLPEPDAADAFQAVCLELFNSLSRLRQVHALRRWLITVTSHHCYQWKLSGRRQDLEVTEVDLDVLPDGEMADRLQRIERRQMIREALTQLPPRCREMIELFLKEPPVPYAELAARFGLAVGSIGFIRKRCLDKLKAALEGMGFHQ